VVTKRVVVTGGAGQIAYSLLFRIGSGDVFGKDQKISISILDVPGSMRVLEGVAMELKDSAFPLLEEVKIGFDCKEIFLDADIVFLVGAKPRGPGMERKDLLLENAKIFFEQGKALDAVAKKNVIILVVGNPCNTNCLIARHFAKRIDPKLFFSMTRLDENRARSFLAEKGDAAISEVSSVPIWGNHSASQVPDFTHATVKGLSVTESALFDKNWLETEFIEKVQKRGAEVIAARGKSSAASAASAAIDAMRSLIFPSSRGSFFSMGVYSEDNPYGIGQGLVFSFPCTNKRGWGELEIVKGLTLNPFLKEKIRISEKELLEEKKMIENLLRA